MVNSCPYFRDILNSIEYDAIWVDSNAPDMPMTMDEIMAWAKGRVENLRKKVKDAAYYFWIEWWVMIAWTRGYLWGVVYIENNDGTQGHYGFSPYIEVPSVIMDRLKAWEELGPLMSELSWVVRLNNKEGSMGAWSDWMFVRKDEFREASKAAIAPFFNKFYQL
jgi:non-canonical (house-cleaning) NTP pyrophosphatase